MAAKTRRRATPATPNAEPAQSPKDEAKSEAQRLYNDLVKWTAKDFLTHKIVRLELDCEHRLREFHKRFTELVKVAQDAPAVGSYVAELLARFAILMMLEGLEEAFEAGAVKAVEVYRATIPKEIRGRLDRRERTKPSSEVRFHQRIDELVKAHKGKVLADEMPSILEEASNYAQSTLTERERRQMVAAYLAEGFTVSQIARWVAQNENVTKAKSVRDWKSKANQHQRESFEAQVRRDQQAIKKDPDLYSEATQSRRGIHLDFLLNPTDPDP